MNRLTRGNKGFIRSLQMSRVSINVFVEGDVDSYFYGQVCRVELGGLFNYRIIRSDQLSGVGQGKSHLLKLFGSMRRQGQLIIDFKGQRSAALFFADKDVDDQFRRLKRSDHLVYTQYYEVENYVFKHGKLAHAVSAACLKDPAEVSNMIPKPEEWARRAALLWSDWLKLCLAGLKFGAPNVCHYSAASAVNGGPCSPMEMALYQTAIADLQAATSYSSITFRDKFSRLVCKVDALYALDMQDILFKGKWYIILLADELKYSGIATGSSTKALPLRLTGHMLQSLDFNDNWAEYHRTAVRRTVALVR